LLGKLDYAHNFDIMQQILTHLFNVYIALKIIVFLSQCILMLNFCVFRRVLWMKIFMCTVQNAHLPVIYIVLDTLIFVKYVIRHSVQRAIW